ncbi:MAG: hypothetical protein GEU83_18185 [Pseudonocardiaceae bacterium]|nr:hypothetical protein [Pseudonocardiaceae bacterium]
MTILDPASTPTEAATHRERALRAAIWVPGLLVATGAAVATAHGLYEVAVAARVPAPIAWLYPLITDGLALVAYAATTRLTGPGRRYAWAVVVLAASLSGLAQASYLASGVASTPAVLRFGVGAWPAALAAAIVAHLLYLLLAERDADADDVQRSAPAERPAVQPAQASVQPQPVNSPAPATGEHPPVQPAAQPTARPDERPERAAQPPAVRPPAPAVSATAPAKDRARSAARRHAAHHGALPTVSVLAELADVARGTAAAALKDLRAQPAQLHAVASQQQERTQP